MSYQTKNVASFGEILQALSETQYQDYTVNGACSNCGAFREEFCGFAFVTRRECLTAYNACTKSCLLGDCERCILNMLNRSGTPFAKIEAVEHSEDAAEPRWTFDTDLPCEELPIMDGDKLHCMAIVFRLEDLPRRGG